MRIPEVQARLREMAKELENSYIYQKGIKYTDFAKELHKLADELSRRPRKMGYRTSDKMTDKKRKQIKELARIGLPQIAIAHKLNISSGRVSETLSGYRD